MYNRYPSKSVEIGNVSVGSNYPIRVQSMVNTKTTNVEGTFLQCKELANVGCELIRITVPKEADIYAFQEIKKRLRFEGISIPLIADVHFNPKIAENIAEIADKIRINPGNYADKKNSKSQILSDDAYRDELFRVEERLMPLINQCKKYRTVIRVGVNHGSLSDRIMNRYGNTAQGMVASAMEFIAIFEKNDLSDLVISLKSSDPRVMIFANRLFVKEMMQRKQRYPLHIGVTEAGEGEEARMKSAVGIGTLLMEGVGDTIRVSLTENPVQEIPFAKRLAKIGLSKKKSAKFRVSGIHAFSQMDQNFAKPGLLNAINIQQKPILVLMKNTSEHFDVLKNTSADFICDSGFILKNTKENNSLQYDNAAILIDAGKFSARLMDNNKVGYIVLSNVQEHNFSQLKKELSDYFEMNTTLLPVFIHYKFEKLSTDEKITATYILSSFLIDGYCKGLIFEGRSVETEKLSEFFDDLMQTLGLKITKATFISCPSCGRTTFDIESLVKRVKAELKGIGPYKIAVMGCVVNGPGEMADADYGCIGTSAGTVNLYKKKKVIMKNVTVAEAPAALLQYIENEQQGNGKSSN